MNYPGTTVQKSDLSGKQFLEGIFLATQGLVMSQLNEITGIQTPAIQNWVNRGFIAHPENRRYNKDMTARIFIINILRETLTLDEICKLLVYVNGRAGDTNDDIIPESQLYAYFCDIVFDRDFSFEQIPKLIEKQLEKYTEKMNGAKQRLQTVLEIMCTAYRASNLLCVTREKLANITNDNIFGETLITENDK